MEDLVWADAGELHPRAPFSRSRMKARRGNFVVIPGWSKPFHVRNGNEEALRFRVMKWKMMGS
ncbi:hypothetical protein MPLB_1870035 [Mesorhizobium sp. ORS 3324]|nr:hypothetical protein MPLB_1870035 [Mesorhizobium sp. ORS 3324]